MSDVPKELRSIFGRHYRDGAGAKSLGPLANFRVSTFVDLLSAVHDKKALDTLSTALASFIQEKDKAAPFLKDINMIAAPKRGNVLLGKAVAEKLDKPTLLARDEILFGRWSEGIVSGRRAILVDDVASDGRLLTEAIQGLQQEGIFVSGVFVLINRKEGSPDKSVKALNIDIGFDAKYHFNDDELRTLRAEHLRQDP